MIVINYKNYVYGSRSLELSKKIAKYLPKAIVSVPALDLKEISAKTKLSVYAEHVDYLETGRNTGFIIPEGVKIVGGSGTLINHSEHKIGVREIEKTIERCLGVGLKTIVCAGSISEAKKILKLKVKPGAIAFEDPVLIGSGKSVTEYNSKAVVKFVKVMKGSGIKALCGAGISSAEDVRAASALGCDGTLIASAIAKSRNPERILKEISGLKIK